MCTSNYYQYPQIRHDTLTFRDRLCKFMHTVIGQQFVAAVTRNFSVTSESYTHKTYVLSRVKWLETGFGFVIGFMLHVQKIAVTTAHMKSSEFLRAVAW
jgi:hypothetical protein